MLILVDVKSIEHVPELINVLLKNNVKNFHVFENESDLRNTLISNEKLQEESSVSESSKSRESSSSRKRSPDTTYKPILDWKFKHINPKIKTELSNYEAKTKRGEYEDFELNDEIRGDLKPRGRPIRRRSSTFAQYLECAICKKTIRCSNANIKTLSSHSIVHSDIMRFKCPVDDCDMKSRQRTTINSHMLRVHNMPVRGVSIPECMGHKEWEQLYQLTHKCFPTLDNK
ncbi:unnamed protein product [Caenorhabditis bovis]|uniref:C2H2-type domain-containing protein n=1 Tax=Caenorhabditis bovis TaxID=2654633 RepID=A0A8S1F712_9PELO|nr:unnamed protein product [Caenorhabditis bovis]